jgi:hypothetical protein
MKEAQMKLKKTAAIAAAAGALTAISVPAMAFENEFHGMYRAYAYFTNSLFGTTGFNMPDKSRTDKFIEQRARLQYIAKASDDLKLVTHFELDTKFGGARTSTKYTTNDAGALDADQITLETKNVYLDFKIPNTPVRTTVGIQPFNDALQGTFGNFDATGAVFTGKFNALTATYGYFTVGGPGNNAPTFDSNFGTQDLNVLDFKYAINKDLTVGTSYYLLLDKAGTATFGNNTVGLNAAAKFGPAALTATLGFQFGKQNNYAANPALSATGTTAFGGTLAATVAAGPGTAKLSALYLSGDKNGTGYSHGWQSIGTGVNYFTPANMWLLTRNVATINSSTAVGGNSDLTWGGRGLMGVFGGYDITAGKVFANANVGYARVAEKQGANSSSIGTEVNATIGYKLYDNLSTSFTGAAAFLGDGMSNKTGTLLPNGKADADVPFLTNIALNYAF